MIPLKCWECGAVCTENSHYGRYPRSFCSNECLLLYHRRNNRGEDRTFARRLLPYFAIATIPLLIFSDNHPGITTISSPDIYYSNQNLADDSADVRERKAETMEMFKALSDLDSSSPLPIYNLALLLQKDGYTRDALHYFHRALIVDSKHTDSLNGLADLYLGNNEQILAIQSLRESLLLFSDQLEATLKLFSAYHELRLEHEAETIGAEIRQKWPDDHILNELNRIAAREPKRDFPDYRKRYQNERVVLLVDPIYKKALDQLKLGNRYAFSKLAEAIIVEKPYFVDLRLSLSEYYYDTQQVDKALIEMLYADYIATTAETKFNLAVGHVLKFHLLLARSYAIEAKTLGYRLPPAFIADLNEKLTKTHLPKLP